MDLITMLQRNPEPLPEWLREPAPAFDRTSFFGSRTVYYPGAGSDGQPVKLCARAHAAHAFIYVDYHVSMTKIRNSVRGIEDPGFRGYDVEHEEEVEESVLRPGRMDTACAFVRAEARCLRIRQRQAVRPVCGLPA